MLQLNKKRINYCSNFSAIELKGSRDTDFYFKL